MRIKKFNQLFESNIDKLSDELAELEQQAVEFKLNENREIQLEDKIEAIGEKGIEKLQAKIPEWDWVSDEEMIADLRKIGENELADQLEEATDELFIIRNRERNSSDEETELVELVTNGKVIGVFSNDAAAEEYCEAASIGTHSIYPLGTNLETDIK